MSRHSMSGHSMSRHSAPIDRGVETEQPSERPAAS